jgi:hypothetical protein
MVMPTEVDEFNFGGCRRRLFDVKHLSVSAVKMSVISRGLGRVFGNVEHLRISTYLSVVNIGEFPNLTYLNLDSNCVSRLSSHTFQSSTKLREIILSFNNLVYLDRELFHNLKELVNVDFHNNKLEFLPKDLFSHNPKLMTINFANNKIGAIDSELFRNLEGLNVINFENNNITHLPVNLFPENHELIANFAYNKIPMADFEPFTKLTIHREGQTQNIREDDVEMRDYQDTSVEGLCKTVTSLFDSKFVCERIVFRCEAISKKYKERKSKYDEEEKLDYILALRKHIVRCCSDQNMRFFEAMALLEKTRNVKLRQKVQTAPTEVMPSAVQSKIYKCDNDELKKYHAQVNLRFSGHARLYVYGGRFVTTKDLDIFNKPMAKPQVQIAKRTSGPKLNYICGIPDPFYDNKSNFPTKTTVAAEQFFVDKTANDRSIFKPPVLPELGHIETTPCNRVVKKLVHLPTKRDKPAARAVERFVTSGDQFKYLLFDCANMAAEAIVYKKNIDIKTILQISFAQEKIYKMLHKLFADKSYDVPAEMNVKFGDLPAEIIIKIASNLDMDDKLCFAESNRRHFGIILDEITRIPNIFTRYNRWEEKNTSAFIAQTAANLGLIEVFKYFTADGVYDIEKNNGYLAIAQKFRNVYGNINF